jgi:ribonuclease Z
MFLGTSAAVPTRDRALPAVAIRREGEVILMDCGEGVQRSALAESVSLGGPMTILITHLHGDHVAGILGLLQTMSLAQRRRPLLLVGPQKLRKWLEITSEMLHIGLTFPVEFVPAKPGKVVRTPGFRVRVARASHSIEAFSYVVEEHGRPGVFYPDRAKNLGIPEGKLWSNLQRGRTVEVDGKKVAPLQVTGPPRPGRRIGYSGDTRPSPGLTRFFAHCDLLIFDSTFSGGDRNKALDRKHSTSAEAATLAKRAGVKRLALTHFSARYTSTAGMVREARRIFPNTVAAKDGLDLEVDYPSP